MKIKSKVISKSKKSTLEKVMGVSIILMFMCLLVVGCPSSSSTGTTAPVANPDNPTVTTNPNDIDSDGTLNTTDVDDDNDGLIEISSLEMLHNMRFDLAGASYKTSASGDGDTTGAPTSATTDCPTAVSGSNPMIYLCGYELTSNLDFDGSDEDETTWTSSTDGSGVTTYTLDMDDDNDTYFNIASNNNGGWLPIGDNSNPFAGIFEGNDFTISNLASRLSGSPSVGLFGHASGNIRNVGLINVFISLLHRGTQNFIGGLVGSQTSGSILSSYVMGRSIIDGGSSDAFSYVGGLVGSNSGDILSSYSTATVHSDTSEPNGAFYTGGLVGFLSGSSSTITASYATGAVNGSTGLQIDFIGGLVGLNSGGNITASYATGDVNGRQNNDSVGGLVGLNQGDITASYATGAGNGGVGNDDVGGLVGLNQGGDITASYATGATNGGVGDDKVGGLLGNHSDGSTTASYTTSVVDGGVGDDEVGVLFGSSSATPTPTITKSYGFGTTMGETSNSFTTTLPMNVTATSGLTLANAGTQWNAATSNSLGAWDFGTTSQAPALNYADYDGTSNNTFVCSNVANPPNNAILIANCGTLLAGQR